jgi:hypothetical protein
MKAIWRPLDVLIDRVADARWLSRERVVAYAGLFLIAQLLLVFFFALQSHGIFGPGPPASTDFLSFYSAGRLADEGRATEIYDIGRLHAMQRTVYGDPAFGEFLFFFYPPVFALLCAVLAFLPYILAFYVWMIGTLGLFAAAIQGILRDRHLTLVILSCPALILNMAIGQNAALSAGLIAMATWLLVERPVFAGMLLGLMCYKPHFLIVAPFALIAGRHWRALATLIGTVALLVVLSIAIFGLSTWQSFLTISEFSQSFFARGLVGFWAAASIFAGVKLVGGGLMISYAAQILAIVCAVAATSYVWHSTHRLEHRGAMFAAATLTAAPVVMSYDVLLGAVAITWLVADARRTQWLSWEKAAYVAIWLIMLVGRGVAERMGAPLLPLIGPLLILLTLRRQSAGFCIAQKPAESEALRR